MRKIISLIAVSLMALGNIDCTSKTASSEAAGSSTIKGTYSR